MLSIKLAHLMENPSKEVPEKFESKGTESRFYRRFGSIITKGKLAVVKRKHTLDRANDHPENVVFLKRPLFPGLLLGDLPLPFLF